MAQVFPPTGLGRRSLCSTTSALSGDTPSCEAGQSALAERLKSAGRGQQVWAADLLPSRPGRLLGCLYQPASNSVRIAALRLFGGTRTADMLTKFLQRSLLVWMLTTLAQAVPAVIIPDLTSIASFIPNTMGWEFTTNSAILVTDLGVFDDSQNGLGQSRPVGIFSNAGVLLASATVPAGAAAPLINQFRSVPITPLLLPAGQTFRIGAFYQASFPSDQIVFSAISVTPAAAINYIGGRLWGSNAGLADPVVPAALTNKYFGPNFEFVLAGAPEINGPFGAPLAFILVMLGVLVTRRERSVAGPTSG